jgi:hypothetical protein
VHVRRGLLNGETLRVESKLGRLGGFVRVVDAGEAAELAGALLGVQAFDVA